MLALSGSSSVAERLKVGCTATTDCASALVAADEGIFKRYGLEVEPILIGITSNIPAAIMSDSIQIGAPTSTVFLQAIDGGLDLVAVSGGTVMTETSNANIAAFVRNGVTLTTPKDFVGKKVGAPGIGAALHVMFVKWLTEKGVDPKGVNFVEVTFPTMADTIKSGGVDAVLTTEPYVSRLNAAGFGTIGVKYALELNRSEPIIFFAASREWANKNAATVARFRSAIAEAAAVVNSDRDKASNSIAKFTKQPLEIVRISPPNRAEPSLKADQFSWWIDVMRAQKMLQGSIELKSVVLD
ncbi:ABC transporter substrate-binding protein [Bradyrhizobium sp. CCBAU 21359]|nr:ABC transporter substrate-binding protein [Bradyrhizobium sp. CCBAU 21360]MDA9457579.1 ABC transporter substrate-binding protein [Bradyrhizobium sp. CCBAU 21359]